MLTIWNYSGFTSLRASSGGAIFRRPPLPAHHTLVKNSCTAAGRESVQLSSSPSRIRGVTVLQAGRAGELVRPRWDRW